MAERSTALAGRLEQAVAEFIGTIEGLSEAQWQTLCPNEARTVGVLARHVAAAIPFEMAVFLQIAAGNQPRTITTAELAEMNAHDADAWADCDRDETLSLLCNNAAAAAAEVRRLDETQLGRTGMYTAELPADWTVEQWLEHILVGHVHAHLDSIRAALTTERSPHESPGGHGQIDP